MFGQMMGGVWCELVTLTTPTCTACLREWLHTALKFNLRINDTAREHTLSRASLVQRFSTKRSQVQN